MIFRSIEYELTGKLLLSCINEHQERIEMLNKLDNYYRGNHAILARQTSGAWTPNNKLVCNFPKYITDTAVGYAFGNPVTYQGVKDTNIIDLEQAYRNTDGNTHDSELAKDLSVFGIGYELVYMGEDKGITQPMLALIDPRNAFVAYDDTVEQKPICGVYYIQKKDEENKPNGYAVTVYTENEIQHYIVKDLSSELSFIEKEPHYFGGVPLVEYFNNEEGMGDFEHVLSLIDAYNVLQSDRVNDKERFVDAILLIKNCTLDDEDGESASKMLVNRILELPGDNANASYLTKTMNESQTEVLKQALAADIHKFSQTPDFTDEQFSSNSSGVAIKYKLLSLENLAKVKERFFVSGLRARMKLFCNILSVKGKVAIDTKSVNIIFNRALPTNEIETAQMLATLGDIVSAETKLSQLTFVKDAKAEAEKATLERQQRAEESARAFGDFPTKDAVNNNEREE